MVSDPPLYKVVILDESHERILRRDLLFGHLKILRTVSYVRWNFEMELPVPEKV
jgi:hypothetical protein